MTSLLAEFSAVAEKEVNRVKTKFPDFDWVVGEVEVTFVLDSRNPRFIELMRVLEEVRNKYDLHAEVDVTPVVRYKGQVLDEYDIAELLDEVWGE